ncbi:MAG: hypothetical protein ACTHU0_09085 [Kofleriaceae bacterium]
MNLKALITTLVLGSSSVAMARPAVSVSAQANTVVQVRDHRTPDRFDQRYQRPRPSHYPQGGYHAPREVTLGSGLTFPRNDDRAYIAVGATKGKFNQVRIEANGGRTLIKQVFIDFGNGQEQLVRGIDRVLTGTQSMTIDLNGSNRSIHRIIVYGENQGVGYRSQAGFDVTAV